MIFGVIIAGSYHFQLIDLYQSLQLLFTLLMLYSTILMTKSTSDSAKSSKLQAEASKLQANAAKETLRASVAPRFIFWIRPANHYWRGPFGERQPKSWKRGVGIYGENTTQGLTLS